jgi:hypothetical protein
VLQRLCFAVCFIFLCQSARAADIRWCTITGKNEENKLIYMPIAKAAHVEGVVILRVNFSTIGDVLKVEPISGPQMLVKSSSEQLKTWHLTTTAVGDAPCQSLVVIKYRLFPENYTLPPVEETPGEFRPAGLYVISIDSHPIVMADPSGSIGR